jgi:hypothetical protein
MKEKNPRAPAGASENDTPELQKKARIFTDPYRVCVSEEAHLLLETLVERCNDDFEGGTVTRSDVANRLIVGAGKIFSDADVKALRNLSFDDRKMLHSLLQRSGKNGELPEDIRRVLRELNGVVEQPKKRGVRSQKDLSVDSDGGSPEAA